jgi:hypothetical protein
MGLQAEMLPVFSWPAAIETLVQHVPFVAMIDLASLYPTFRIGALIWMHFYR